VADRGARWSFGWDASRARTWLRLAAGAILAGGVAGAAAAGTLPASLAAMIRQDLSIYLGSLVAAPGGGAAAAAWRAAVLLDARVALLMWLGGLFAFGGAVTLPALFAEGFAQGFGLAAVASASSPPVTVAAAIPVLMAAAVLAALGAVALALAWRQIGARRGRASPPLPATYVAYTLALVAAAAVLTGTCAIQAYGLAWAVHLLA
jgi:hypothetical protein